ncbi:MAG TPA: (Fe-S)-binding protein, partial [Polyangiaceae bacterium]|nr:(Fe-S)-binding protein [Polyangiaceae bacterium]
MKLPVLSESTRALETCGYCPKLCRAKCPVSNAEPRDTLTPWGKMSLAWFAERGDVPSDLAHADVVWGCTGCFACNTACEHDNPVVPTLLSARQHVRRHAAAPPGIERLLARHAQRSKYVAERVARASRQLSLDDRSPRALLIGCGYWLNEPALAVALSAAFRKLVGDFRLVAECCGAVHAGAGDTLGLSVQRQRTEQALAGAKELLVYDPGCAMAVEHEAVRTVVEVVADSVDRLQPIPARVAALGPLRYHDPCQLGRGLGIYDAPRRVLARLAGQPVAEFRHRRRDARCSGAGALLPQSFAAA